MVSIDICILFYLFWFCILIQVNPITVRYVLIFWNFEYWNYGWSMRIMNIEICLLHYYLMGLIWSPKNGKWSFVYLLSAFNLFKNTHTELKCVSKLLLSFTKPFKVIYNLTIPLLVHGSGLSKMDLWPTHDPVYLKIKNKTVVKRLRDMSFHFSFIKIIWSLSVKLTNHSLT